MTAKPCQELLDKNCLKINDKRRTITLEENKRKYIVSNPMEKAICVYRVDGCVMKGDTIKCDYIFLNSKDFSSYFVELKGQDLVHAIRQIDKSIDFVKPSLIGYKIFGRAVLTKANTPDLKSSELIKLELKLRSLGGNFRKQVNQMPETI